MAQIGTVKVETPSGIKSLPVFAEADSGGSVYEMVKVDTPSGIGFIPMVKDSGDATFPYVKVQTANQGIVHAHDAASLGIVDDFEDGNITEYSGDTGEFTTQQSVVIDGSYTLQGDWADIDNYHPTIISTSGLENYPEAGDTFRYKTRLETTDAISDTLFGVTDTNNSYNVRLNGDDLLQLYKDAAGTQLASTNVTVDADTNYIIEVDWASDNTITVKLLDSGETQLASISATDSTYTSGGIGFHITRNAFVSPTAYWDSYKIV